MNIPKPSNSSVINFFSSPYPVSHKCLLLPIEPNTGPGSARFFVNQIAIPSPNKCVESPEIYVSGEHELVPEIVMESHLEFHLNNKVGRSKW